MAIKRPDIYEHNNPNNAFVDSDSVRGGTRTPVADLSELYSLATKIDQLKERSTRVFVRSENAYYELVDIENIDKPSGWGKELQIENEIFLVVSTRPTTGVENKIYIIPADEPTSENEFDEWIWVNGTWERIGGLSIDLSNYYTKTQSNNLLNNKVDKDGDKQLSDENFSHEEKQKLDGIEEGAQKNVIPDWDADTDNPRRIDNKPTKTSDFVNDGDKTSPFATLKDIYRTNIVLNYGIVNVEGTYQYDLWADRYIINNVLYTEMLTGSVTLSSPHATLDRIDKIVIHSDGEFRVKQGVPAENPVSPQVDAQTEVEVRFILVKGGSTEPETDVYRVFDENEGLPNEWNVSFLQGNIDPDNVEYASRGTKSIKFNIDTGVPRIRFSPAESIPFEDFSELLLDVRAVDDHNMFILQINDVNIDQLVHGVRGFIADGNFHTVSFRKDEILTMFEQYGAPTDGGINEIHLWQDNNTHNYWVDNIRLVKDDSGGSPQPVRIQRTSEIPINDGATGKSPYAEIDDVQDAIDEVVSKSILQGADSEETIKFLSIKNEIGVLPETIYFVPKSHNTIYNGQLTIFKYPSNTEDYPEENDMVEGFMNEVIVDPITEEETYTLWFVRGKYLGTGSFFNIENYELLNGSEEWE